MFSQKCNYFPKRESLKATKTSGEYLQKDLRLYFENFCYIRNKDKIGTIKPGITFSHQHERYIIMTKTGMVIRILDRDRHRVAYKKIYLILLGIHVRNYYQVKSFKETRNVFLKSKNPGEG